jgi:hypothetical protein
VLPNLEELGAARAAKVAKLVVADFEVGDAQQVLSLRVSDVMRRDAA